MVNNNLAYQLASAPELGIMVEESPIKWCSISLSEVIEKGKRLEASVYDVEAKQAYMRVKNGLFPSVDLIGEHSPVQKAHYGGRLKRNYIDKNCENAVGFIGSSEMLDISPQPIKFMIDDERVSDLHVKKGTVLISRSGTIGNMSFVNDTLEKFLISEHAMRLECNSYPGYVYAYLKTKTGQALIRSNIYGSVIQQIEPEHLASIPIPDAPREMKSKVDNLIVQSYTLRDESNALLEQATQMMIEELHLPKIEDLDVEYFISEFCGLTIQDVEFEEMRIKVDHQLQRTSQMEYVIQQPKTESGIRYVPMTEEVASCFRRIIANRAVPKTEPMVDGYVGFLFLDKNDMPMVALHWEKYLEHIVQKYNKIYRIQMPKVTPHVCRHTFCSNMAKSGMNPKTLQYIMGHADISVTLNTYTHVKFDDAKDELLRVANA